MLSRSPETPAPVVRRKPLPPCRIRRLIDSDTEQTPPWLPLRKDNVKTEVKQEIACTEDAENTKTHLDQIKELPVIETSINVKADPISTEIAENISVDTIVAENDLNVKELPTIKSSNSGEADEQSAKIVEDNFFANASITTESKAAEDDSADLKTRAAALILEISLLRNRIQKFLS
uniref:Uncharacterized protein n=1 Tax=Panagrolaimus sp. JU765 TaxID=591449 RepID=A0AC34QAN5_9BILA